MRLLIIVDIFVPARTSGALQMRDLVQEMRAQGHSPTVIVPAPKMQVPWRIDDVDGVEVLRVRTLESKDVNKIQRLVAEWQLSNALLRGLRRSPLANIKWDGIVWYSPTIFLGSMVHRVKRQCHCPSYLILRDLFPDWAVDAGILRKGLLYRFFKRIERRQYEAADVIGVQTPANQPLVQAECSALPRIEVLSNWLAAPKPGNTSVRLSPNLSKARVIFVYAGNMGVAQGMDCLIELAIALRDRIDAGFLFVGRGSEVSRLRRVTRKNNLENVQFVDEIDADEIPSLLAQCHVGLIALDPRHTTHNIPGKLLTYLHAGLPVLARINPGNDLESLINTEGIGFVVAGDDQEAVVSAAETLLSNSPTRAKMAGQCRAVVERLFSPKQAVDQIIKALSRTPASCDRQKMK